MDLSSPSVWITYNDALSIEVLLSPLRTVEAVHAAARTQLPTISADGRWVHVDGASPIDATRLRVGPLDHPPGTLLSITGAPYRWRPLRLRLERLGVTTLSDPTPAILQTALTLNDDELTALYAPYDALGVPQPLVTARISDVLSLLTALNRDPSSFIRTPNVWVNRQRTAPLDLIHSGQLPRVEQHVDPELLALELGIVPPWRSPG